MAANARSSDQIHARQQAAARGLRKPLARRAPGRLVGHIGRSQLIVLSIGDATELHTQRAFQVQQPAACINDRKLGQPRAPGVERRRNLVPPRARAGGVAAAQAFALDDGLTRHLGFGQCGVGKRQRIAAR